MIINTVPNNRNDPRARHRFGIGTLFITDTTQSWS
jgi:hypothetical protein